MTWSEFKKLAATLKKGEFLYVEIDGKFYYAEVTKVGQRIKS